MGIASSNTARRMLPLVKSWLPPLSDSFRSVNILDSLLVVAVCIVVMKKVVIGETAQLYILGIKDQKFLSRVLEPHADHCYFHDAMVDTQI